MLSEDNASVPNEDVKAQEFEKPALVEEGRLKHQTCYPISFPYKMKKDCIFSMILSLGHHLLNDSAARGWKN